MSIVKLYGPPGTGKTTELLNLMEKSLSEGVRPLEIGFFSFTNKAANEAKERAMKKFGDYQEQDFHYFRTLHSLALERIGGHRKHPCMGRDEWTELGGILGIEFTGSTHKLWDEEMKWDGATKGDKMRALVDIARLRDQTLKLAWQASEIDNINFYEIERFEKHLKAYKAAHGFIDFVDMLEMACADPSTLPSFKVLFIDEAQDLSALQFRLCRLLVDRSVLSFFAGDDDQAVYKWAGACVETFNGLPGESRVLDQSYRVPGKPARLASLLRQSIKTSVPKAWKPRPDEGGLHYHLEITPHTIGLDEGNWLILVRNNYQTKKLVEICVEHGFTFTCRGSFIKSASLRAVAYWEDLRAGKSLSRDHASFAIGHIRTGAALRHGAKEAVRRAQGVMTLARLKEEFGLGTDEIWHKALDMISKTETDYFLRCRERGEKLLKEPRIRISTIHQAKGGEADNVLLLTDCSFKTREAYEKNPEDERRVWYVGITRTRQNLHIVMPQTKSYFPELL